MTEFEQLPPDQRAAVSLLLRQRRRYDEVAATLAISAQAVHDRAHAALAVLAPQQAQLLDPAAREQIGEYLLGQQSAEEAARTKERLAASRPAREWARALAVELVKLTAEPLPEIPAAVAPGPSSPAPAPAAAPPGASAASESQPGLAPPPQPPISRRGGALLLAAILVAAAVLAIVLSSGGSGSSGGGAHQTASRSAGQPSSTQGSKSEGGGRAAVEKVAELKATAAGGAARGAAAIASEGDKHALVLNALGLAATNGFSYVVWLLGKHGEATPFGRTPPVGASGRVRAVEVLAANPHAVAGVEITRETSAHPRAPGTVVLKGRFSGG